MNIGRGRTATVAEAPDMTVETCWMCGVQQPANQMLPDGGNACADVRWYCLDAVDCTHRWTRLGRVDRTSW